MPHRNIISFFRNYRLVTVWIFLLQSVVLMSQTQHGVVRTALRPNKKIVYLPGVTIRQRGGHTAVLSGAGGKFEMTMSKAKAGDAFYLSSVRKSGYELVDNRTIGRAFTYSSKVPIEIVMINTREKEEDVRRISDNSYRRAEKTYKQRISKLEKQLSEKTISEASYRKQLQDLQTWFEKYESLINSMAERYASTDYATIDSLNAAINIAIENGELERADSLISTAGSLEKMVKENKEAERKANERLNIGRDIMENATADLTSIRNDKNRLADLLYSKYSICLTRAERDSAAYYIQMRAELDTTNVDWQLEAGRFIDYYLTDYEEAMTLYKRALDSAVEQFGDSHPDVATSYNNIGLVYKSQGNYAQALEYYNKALEIRLSMLGDSHPDVANSYHNIGYVYNKLGKYTRALENFNKALEIYLSAFGENHPNVFTSYCNIGITYYMQGLYSEAKVNLLKAVEIGKTFLNVDDFNMQTLLSLLYRSLIRSSSPEDDEHSSFMSDKAFTAKVVSDETPASQQGMSGEYYLLEYSDWNFESSTDLFDKNDELKDKPKDIVVMKDGVITKHHFENKIGIQLGLKFVSKEEKQRITEAYHKWKEEQGNDD